MGYDFEALEDGELTVEIRNHDSSKHEIQTQKYQLKKGELYDIDYYGVKIRER